MFAVLRCYAITLNSLNFYKPRLLFSHIWGLRNSGSGVMMKSNKNNCKLDRLLLQLHNAVNTFQFWLHPLQASVGTALNKPRNFHSSLQYFENCILFKSVQFLEAQSLGPSQVSMVVDERWWLWSLLNAVEPERNPALLRHNLWSVFQFSGYIFITDSRNFKTKILLYCFTCWCPFMMSDFFYNKKCNDHGLGLLSWRIQSFSLRRLALCSKVLFIVPDSAFITVITLSKKAGLVFVISKGSSEIVTMFSLPSSMMRNKFYRP